MGGCSFESEDGLDGLSSEHGISESVSDMGEFLVLSPLDIVLGALAVVVVVGLGSALEGLKVVQFLGLREPCSCGLSPPVVVLKVHVVQMDVSIPNGLHLIEVGRNIASLIEVLRPDLADVKVNEVMVVGVDFVEFVLGKILGVEPSLNVHIFVRKNHGWVSVGIAGGLLIVDLQVLAFLVLIN